MPPLPLSSQASSSSRLALRLSSSPRSFLLPRRLLSSSSPSLSSEEAAEVDPSSSSPPAGGHAAFYASTAPPTRPKSSLTRSLPDDEPMVLRGSRLMDRPTHQPDPTSPLRNGRVWNPIEYDLGEPRPVAMDRASNDDLFKWARNAGSVWKWPTKGQTNWLGGDVPYPENPYFKPSPPLSCDLQAEVYEGYTQFPPSATSLFRINALSATYGISKDRIRGIIKTGQVGESWKRLVSLNSLFRRHERGGKGRKEGKESKLTFRFDLRSCVSFADLPPLASLLPRPQNIPEVKTFARGMESFLCVPRHLPRGTRTLSSPSPAIAEFQTYLASRIDIERDEETVKLEKGERTFRTEDSGFVPLGFQGGARLGAMSWEFADEGHLPTTFKIDMEKPLRPPPTLPHFPAKVVQSGKEAVWNFVNVGDKFAGQGWDGALQRPGHHPPSRKGAVRRFIPLVTSKVNLSGSRDPTITSANVLSKREKLRRAFAEKAKLNKAGIFTPEQVILAKMKKPNKEFRHVLNAKIMQQKRESREANLEAKARKRIYDRVADVKAFKARGVWMLD
ncbi:hypothetical protein BDY24DRAFT_95642 [Mrakia frigida]|uniref:uncharacterized protein n=1 Tax=Mrakia frigida TaxID=29902 RepID=UPI003FCC18E8